MYKIMIVDDEPLILAGIASLAVWEQYDCRIVCKALNGKQALELMEQQQPDIIVSDIKMPAMDGITFMKEAKKINEKVIFIFLTNLEEFSLIKEAIRLGAVDYLIKLELDEEKVGQTLERAIRQFDLMHISEAYAHRLPVFSEEERIKRYLTQIIREEPVDEEEEEIIPLIGRHYPRMILVMVNLNFGYDGIYPAFTQKDKMQVIKAAEDIINKMVKYDFDDSSVIKRDDGSFLLVLSVSEPEDYEDQIRSMGRKFASVLKDYFEVSISVAASSADTVSRISQLLYQVTSAMNLAYSEAPGQVIFYSAACEESTRHSSNFDITFLKKDLEQMIVQNNSEGLAGIISQVAALLRENKASRLQAVHACINLYYYLTSFFDIEEKEAFPYAVNSMEQLNRTSNLSEVVQWLEGFGGQVILLMKSRVHTKLDRYVELAKVYVEDNLTDKILLSEAAEQLNISPGYLSSIFRKQTEMKFSDYVIEQKINKAKELIREEKYMMYEISAMLGFDNQFYFCKVFKRKTGCTPKEYEAAGSG